MSEPASILGIPLAVILWCLGRCSLEVGNADDLDPLEANRLLLKCFFDCLVPGGLPEPDRYKDDTDDSG